MPRSASSVTDSPGDERSEHLGPDQNPGGQEQDDLREPGRAAGPPAPGPLRPPRPRSAASPVPWQDPCDLRPPCRGRASHGGYWLRSRTVSVLGDVEMAELGRRPAVPCAGPCPAPATPPGTRPGDRRRWPSWRRSPPAGCRSSSRSATGGCSPRRSPSSAARRRDGDDLAAAPITGLTVQLCGDAHLLNFGVFASPERDAGVRHQRLRRDAAGPVRVGPQAPAPPASCSPGGPTASARPSRRAAAGGRRGVPRRDRRASPGWGRSRLVRARDGRRRDPRAALRPGPAHRRAARSAGARQHTPA